MKKIVSSLFLTLISLPFFAQSQSERSVLVFEPHQLNQGKFEFDDFTVYKISCLGEIPLDHIEPFLAYSIVWYAKDWQAENQMKVSFYNGETQTTPIFINTDPHATPREGQYISQLYFTEKDVKKIRIQQAGLAEIERIEVHFFSPGKTVAPAPAITDSGDRLACPCPQPTYLDRLGWCPDGTCPEDATPAFTTVTHLIVHHSAGSNSSSDWAATVRSIYDFHVFTNGWDDIGYNWLIDPNGVVYEGRGDNVRGAHFCGFNAGTMGVCMMGDYTSIVPTDQAVGSLENLLAWKSCDADIEPNGEAFHASSGLDLMHISGHRDGCATACPGNSFYPTLPAVREAVQNKLDTECNDLVILSPTNLELMLNPDEEILLTWEDNADNETGYQVERSFNMNNSFAIIANLPANSTEYVDASAATNFQYYYRVKATIGDSSSTYSNEVIYSPPSADLEELNKKSVSIFPNPTEGKVQVKIENNYLGKLEITIFDALGRQQQLTKLFDKNSVQFQLDIDLTEFAKGVYFIKINQDGEMRMFQVLRI
ncbi:MAG: N-acetylmuramoyl-L-alanine amidase [Saprospiraceae bacterium]